MTVQSLLRFTNCHSGDSQGAVSAPGRGDFGTSTRDDCRFPQLTRRPHRGGDGDERQRRDGETSRNGHNFSIKGELDPKSFADRSGIKYAPFRTRSRFSVTKRVAGSN
ncbi:hypothetical protein GCM10007304_47290 [Rhodococcoides trifolii]|uniref:Uncharacterized protein n=1 Tax=Rhodococcoides trifolii TaxID=908250 RepID=A0A917G8H8_9NOCA|nr:hypothetical protein GCM10007304_47290 [Rhodococcus trifolii]